SVASTSPGGGGELASTIPSRFFSRRPVSSSARYSASPCSTWIDPSALPPAHTATQKFSAIHDLPAFGGPASSDTPSPSTPSTAHFGSGKSAAIRSRAVHD